MVTYHTVRIGNVDIFYREAGPPGAPTIVLLHGFPSSSHMYRDLMRELEGDFHLIAPDYPGFGNSAMPSKEEFAYTFDHLSEVMEQFLRELGLERFTLYLQDYGGPVGFRIAVRHPGWIEALVIQNANAYEEGLTPLLELRRPYWGQGTGENERVVLKTFTMARTQWKYLNGARDKSRISPDAWNMDQFFLERTGSKLIHLQLQADYGSNVKRYPEWQDYFRRYQPPTLIVWGRNDEIYGPKGAEAYKRDLRNIEVHLLKSGRFALEEYCVEMADHLRRFLKAHGLRKAA